MSLFRVSTVFCLSCVLLLKHVNAYDTFRLGGIFGAEEEDQELAFKLGVYQINKINKYPFMKFAPITARIVKNNTLEVSKIACALLGTGLIGIFGPSYPSSSEYVQSLCDSKEMPHIEMHEDNNKLCTRCLVNVHPYPPTLTTSIIDIIHKLEWKKFTFIYQDYNSLPRISQILNMEDYEQHEIKIRELEDDGTGSYKKFLKYLKATKEANYILDLPIDILEEYLLQAQQVGMITDRQSYIITSLDMHTINMAQYQDSGAFILGISITNPNDERLIDTAIKIQEMKEDLGHPPDPYVLSYVWKMRLSTVLIIDAIHLFYEAATEMEMKKLQEVKPLYCNATDNFRVGSSIINYMKTVKIEGLTGEVKFDTEGLRTNFHLDIIQLTESGLIKIGSWNPSTGADIKTYKQEKIVIDDGTLRNVTFKIITALVAPYTMLKETSANLVGNDRFEGFCIDIIHELSQMLFFNYTYEIQEDGNYGKPIGKGRFDGMLGKVIDGTMDLGIADLTITSEREKAVDFTLPFMNLGISILYRKPEPVPPSLFTFASPFSHEVWLMLAVAYFFVSASLFIIARLNPKEWNNQNPCVEDPDYLTNQFGVRDSLWFVIGSLMQQGSEIAPSGISTRMIAGLWWFFTLIMVSSYTANLCAFLTVETLVTPFNNIEELVNQKIIKYGAKTGGATESYFKESDMESYSKVWEYMYNNPNLMTHSNDDGIERVEFENYAFLMESTSIEYTTERKCNLTQVGRLLDEKGYGIAMKKDSPYRNSLSTAILKLQEGGKLTELKIRWWKEKRGGGFCSKRPNAPATPLDLKNVGGVFFVLTVGTILGVFCTLIEVALYARNISLKEKVSFKQVYMEEIRFFLKFKHMTRPVRSSSVTQTSISNSLKN